MTDRSEESFAIELRGVFLMESQEMLDDTEIAFIKIESDPEDIVTIDRIFRHVHTIKGSAYVAGFPQLGNFAHSFEALLSSIRDRKIRVTTKIVDVLLAGNDCLRQFIAALKDDPQAQVDTVDVTSRIKDVLASSNQPILELTKLPDDKTIAKGDFSPDTQQSELANTANNRRTILVCDDNRDILDFLREALVEEGYKVASAENGILALKIMREQPIDVILSDLKMPEMDGEQFIRQIRKINQLVPIVVMSGHSSREDLKRFIKLGIDEFIDKPFTIVSVLRAVSRAIKVRSLREALIGISRLSFRAYVSLQKIESLNASSNSTEDAIKEKEHLDKCLAEMRSVTIALLDSERAIMNFDIAQGR